MEEKGEENLFNFKSKKIQWGPLRNSLETNTRDVGARYVWVTTPKKEWAAGNISNVQMF